MAFKSTQWKEIDGEKWFRFSSGWDRFRYHWGNIVTTILIILLVTMMVYSYKNIEAIKTTPLLYAAQKNLDNTGEELSCTCVQGDPHAIYPKVFYFNRTTVWVPDPVRTFVGKGMPLNASMLQPASP